LSVLYRTMEGRQSSPHKWGCHLSVNSGSEKNLRCLDKLMVIEATM